MVVAVCGTGFLGGSMIKVLESRGYKNIVRYDIGEHIGNAKLVGTADVVFVCVPTPSVGHTQDLSAVRSVMNLVPRLVNANERRHPLVVVRSTVRPDYMADLAQKSGLNVMHVPEFLDAARAEEMAMEPYRMVFGWASEKQMAEWRDQLIDMFPVAPVFDLGVEEAAMVKYAANCFFTLKNVYMNAVYDALACSYPMRKDAVRFGPEVAEDPAQEVLAAVCSDPRIGHVHGRVKCDGGRGAGNVCLVKDTAAFIGYLEKFGGSMIHRGKAARIMELVEEMNVDNLERSGKDMHIVHGIYGEDVPRRSAPDYLISGTSGIGTMTTSK